MLTQKYRPKRFQDVVAQEEAVTVLQAISLRPETAPRVVILTGPFGTGKTSLARVFGKALNCLSRKGDACGQCEVCCTDDRFSPLYQENDASMVGNVAFVREYRDRLEQTDPPDGKYRVIVFDEVQEASQQSMDVMLKILEDSPERTFFVFCTTEIQKIHDTIRSRAIELPLSTVHPELVAKHLSVVAAEEGLVMSQEAIRQISICCGGHMRNALMKLDVFRLCEDKTVFTRLVISCEDVILRFLRAAREQNRQMAEECIKDFSSRPLAYLTRDWELVALGLLRGFSGDPNVMYADTVKLYGVDVTRIMRAMASDWGVRCFRDDLMYQAFCWYLYHELGQKKVAAPTTSQYHK